MSGKSSNLAAMPSFKFGVAIRTGNTHGKGYTKDIYLYGTTSGTEPKRFNSSDKANEQAIWIGWNVYVSATQKQRCLLSKLQEISDRLNTKAMTFASVAGDPSSCRIGLPYSRIKTLPIPTTIHEQS